MTTAKWTPPFSEMKLRKEREEADRQRRIMARVLRDRKRDNDPDDDRD